MKVEVVEVAPMKVEVPFVLGGVYRQENAGGGVTYWTIVEAQGRYRWIDLTDNRACDITNTMDEMVRTIRSMMVYLPGAFLTIPREVDSDAR